MEPARYIACDNSECEWCKTGRCSLDTINLRRIRNHNGIAPLSELSCLNFFHKLKKEEPCQLGLTER